MCPPLSPRPQLSRELGRAGWMTWGPRVCAARGSGVLWLAGRPRPQAGLGICFTTSPVRSLWLVALHQQHLSRRGLSSRRAQVPNAAVQGSCREGHLLVRDKSQTSLKIWLMPVSCYIGRNLNPLLPSPKKCPYIWPPSGRHVSRQLLSSHLLPLDQLSFSLEMQAGSFFV